MQYFNEHSELDYMIIFNRITISFSNEPRLIRVLTESNFGKIGFSILKKYFDTNKNVNCSGAINGLYRSPSTFSVDNDQYLINALRSKQRNFVLYLLNRIGFTLKRNNYQNEEIINSFLYRMDDEFHYNIIPSTEPPVKTISNYIIQIYKIVSNINRYDRDSGWYVYENIPMNQPISEILYNKIKEISIINKEILSKIVLIANCIEMFSLKKYENFIDYYCKMIGYNILLETYEIHRDRFPDETFENYSIYRATSLYTTEFSEKLIEINEIYGNLLKEIRHAILFKEKVTSFLSCYDLKADSDDNIDFDVKKDLYTFIFNQR
jgi:hypothetical protein